MPTIEDYARLYESTFEPSYDTEIDLNEAADPVTAVGVTMAFTDAVAAGAGLAVGAAAAELAVAGAVVGVPLLAFAAKKGFDVSKSKLSKFINRRKDLAAMAKAGGEEKALKELVKLNREIHAEIKRVLPQSYTRGQWLNLLNDFKPGSRSYSARSDAGYREMLAATKKAQAMLDDYIKKNPEVVE